MIWCQGQRDGFGGFQALEELGHLGRKEEVDLVLVLDGSGVDHPGGVGMGQQLGGVCLRQLEHGVDITRVVLVRDEAAVDVDVRKRLNVLANAMKATSLSKSSTRRGVREVFFRRSSIYTHFGAE